MTTMMTTKKKNRSDHVRALPWDDEIGTKCYSPFAGAALVRTDETLAKRNRAKPFNPGVVRGSRNGWDGGKGLFELLLHMYFFVILVVFPLRV